MNSDGKTLIILTPGFAANETDSTCMPFPQLFVKKLKELNPSLNIIVFAFQYPFVKTIYAWHNIKVIAFGGQSKGNIRHLILWITVWKRLKMILRDNNTIGILNFWLGESSLIGKWAARKYNLKSFSWLLGQDARPGNRYFSIIKPKAENLIALSDFISEEFYRNYKVRPANIIPPGIDVNEFSGESVVRDIDILGCGSLIPLKRFEIFITIVARLTVTKPNIKTIICGDGPQKKFLQKMIDESGLSGNIVLCGELSHDKVLQLMQRSKIFLHPSSYEGFATVMNEALYAGTQVISFCKPMNIIFSNQHVAESRNGMTEKINELLNSENLNHESVLTNSIESTCQKISALFGI